MAQSSFRNDNINNNNNISGDEIDDDGEIWEPLNNILPPSSVAEPQQQLSCTNSTQQQQQRVGGAIVKTTTTTASGSNHDNESSSSSYRKERMQLLRSKLETKNRLRKNFIDHPMQIFWSTFIIYLCQELWNLNWKLQLSLALLVIGTCTKMAVLSTLIFWYPRWICVPILLVLPFLYLHPQYYSRALANLIQTVSCPATLATTLATQFDPQQLRRLCLALLLIPTVLEMRTCHFLSQIANDQSTALSLFCIIVLSTTLGYSYRVQKVSPHECTRRGLIVLYGTALLRVAIVGSVWDMPLLIAPFSLATGVLLYDCNDDEEWLSRAIRMALRKTLRDVLAKVGTQVQQDEMLQIAMIRWIVDYWANTTTTSTANNSSAAGGSSSHPQQQSPSASFSSTTTTPSRGNSSRPEVQWTELLPMLTMTTDQMATEVETLQQTGNSSNNNQGGPTTTESSGPSTSSYATSSTAGSSSSSSTPAPTPTPMAAEAAAASPSSVSSVHNLQSMLANMDLDQQAQPAVEAYERGVQNFPPSQPVAIAVSVVRRCPALLTLAIHVLFGCPLATYGFLSSLLLVPIVVFELLRVQEWSDSCQRAMALAAATTTTGSNSATTTDGSMPGKTREGNNEVPSNSNDIKSVDSMILLFSHDRLKLYEPPSLLVVWMNICSSVSALQVGLTAARCVQTTALSVEFCYNLLSLAQLGVEVSQFGWIHGLAVIAKEFVAHHSHNNNNNNRSLAPAGDNGGRTKYTSAAFNAVNNSRKISHNFKIIMEHEDHANQIFAPVVGVLSIIVGRGWLWGRDEHETRPMPQSTVQIEELDNNAEDSGKAKVDAVKEQNDVRLLLGGGKSTQRDQLETARSKSASSSAVVIEELVDGGPDKGKRGTEASLQTTASQEAGYALIRVDEGNNMPVSSKNDSSVLAADTTSEGVTETNVFEMTLREGIVTESKDGPSESMALTRLSEVMELVASCAEQNLIDDTDKNLFFERLATVKEDSESDLAWLEGTRRTLEVLLSHAGEDEAKEDSSKPIQLPGLKEETDISKVSKPVPESESKADQAPEESVRRDDVEIALTTIEPLQNDSKGSSEKIDDPKVSHKLENCPPTSQSLATALVDSSATTKGEDDDGFEPLVIPQGINSSVQKDAVNATPDRDDDRESNQPLMTKSEDSNNDQMWAQGLAVLGAAVVGGVALAMRNQSGGDKPDEQRRRTSHHNDNKTKPHHRHHHGNNGDWNSL